MNRDEIINSLVTLGDWIRYAASRFAGADVFLGHGYQSAWDEAVQLVLDRLYLPANLTPQIIQSYLLHDERISILAAIEKRVIARIPLAYILRKAWFCGLPFYVDERVLIPRSPIAELIEKQFQPWIGELDVQTILDIGTGSGCIGIAAAMFFPDASVDLVDVSKDALLVAEINVKQYQLEQRVHLIHSDCFSSLNNRQYDLIISNPPYVGDDELATLPAEYHHEPRQALYADQNGMAIVAKILNQAATHLTERGILIVEVGYSEENLIQLFPDLPFTWVDLEHGGDGVFLLTKQQLQEYKYEQ